MSCVGHGFFGKGKKKFAVSVAGCHWKFFFFVCFVLMNSIFFFFWKFYKYNYLVRHLSKYLRPFYSK